MKYKIIYYYNGGHSLSSRIIEAKNEKEALARLQGVYGHNPRYEIKRIIPQMALNHWLILTTKSQR